MASCYERASNHYQNPDINETGREGLWERFTLWSQEPGA